MNVIHPLVDRLNDLYVRHKPNLLSLGCGGSQGGPHGMFSQPPTPRRACGATARSRSGSSGQAARASQAVIEILPLPAAHSDCCNYYTHYSARSQIGSGGVGGCRVSRIM